MKSLRRQVIRSTTALSAGQALIYGCSFARNVILARLLTKTDFGIAATFAITISLFEMVSNLSTSRLLVQAEEGEDPTLQSMAHSLEVIRGLVSAILILLLAWPFSLLFGVPEACGSFQLLALVPFLKGFVHLDVNRLEREMRFGPAVLVEVVPQIVITAAAWPLAVALGNYSAMVWLLIAKWAMTLIASHFCAQRRYCLGWNRSHAKLIFNFGWPLVINSLIMFGIVEGDRLIVGAGITMEALGAYSVATALVAAPSDLILKIVSSIVLPLLSRVQNEREEYAKRYALCAQSLSLIAAMMGVALTVAGGCLIRIIFGAKYGDTGAIIGWIAAAQAVRIIRAAPTLAAMAKGDTQNIMMTNVARSIGLGLAGVAVANGKGIQWIAASACVGEISAVIVAVLRLWIRQRLSRAISLQPFAFALAVMGVGGALVGAGLSGNSSVVVLSAAATLTACVFAGGTAVFHGIREEMKLVFDVINRRFGLLPTMEARAKSD